MANGATAWKGRPWRRRSASRQPGRTSMSGGRHCPVQPDRHGNTCPSSRPRRGRREAARSSIQDARGSLNPNEEAAGHSLRQGDGTAGPTLQCPRWERQAGGAGQREGAERPRPPVWHRGRDGSGPLGRASLGQKTAQNRGARPPPRGCTRKRKGDRSGRGHFTNAAQTLCACACVCGCGVRCGSGRACVCGARVGVPVRVRAHTRTLTHRHVQARRGRPGNVGKVTLPNRGAGPRSPFLRV